MPRAVLDDTRIHSAIRERIAGHHRSIVDAAGIARHYFAYGSCFSQWRRRTALKMWSRWPTLPLVFVRGTLIDGADDLAALLASGEPQRMLA